MPSENE